MGVCINWTNKVLRILQSILFLHIVRQQYVCVCVWWVSKASPLIAWSERSMAVELAAAWEARVRRSD